MEAGPACYVCAMDFEWPPPDDRRRLAVRAWLRDHPQPSGRELAEAGYTAPHWPRPWGLEADPVHRLLIGEELEAAGVELPDNPIGLGWAGPTILHAGTATQRERYLWPLLTGEEVWCQLFSEPGAGSDLASLTTRAERDGDEYVVSGQKVWTSMAHRAAFGILLARTDPEAPRHEGISYFVCPMDRPGIDVRPIVEMTGVPYFNEVFLDEVRIPVENLVGEENRGWALARLTLGNERLSLSSGGALWGMGPTTADLVEIARREGLPDRGARDRLMRLHIAGEVLRLVGLRVLSELVHGREPGPEAAVRKLMADRHGQLLMDLAKDLAGPAGMLTDRGPLGTDPGEWHWGFTFAPALTIGGGTAEILRNIIGERMLGLPREPAGDRPGRR